MKRNTVCGAVAVALCAGLATMSVRTLAAGPAARAGEVAVRLDGGYDTGGPRRGRPVVLIAAALGVPDDVFREAFSHVRPSRNGPPTGDEARRNKHELLSRLATYGVTNERLDEVSNYYRYRPQDGELWTHRPAVVFATVKDGVVTGFRIADAGAGYSSPPTVSIDGQPDLAAKVVLRFEKNLAKNGSIESVSVAPPATQP